MMTNQPPKHPYNRAISATTGSIAIVSFAGRQVSKTNSTSSQTKGVE